MANMNTDQQNTGSSSNKNPSQKDLNKSEGRQDRDFYVEANRQQESKDSDSAGASKSASERDSKLGESLPGSEEMGTESESESKERDFTDRNEKRHLGASGKEQSQRNSGAV